MHSRAGVVHMSPCSAAEQVGLGTCVMRVHAVRYCRGCARTKAWIMSTQLRLQAWSAVTTQILAPWPAIEQHVKLKADLQVYWADTEACQLSCPFMSIVLRMSFNQCHLLLPSVCVRYACCVPADQTDCRSWAQHGANVATLRVGLHEQQHCCGEALCERFSTLSILPSSHWCSPH